MQNKIWNLFKLTGDIKYYMMYKEMENLEVDETREDKGNSN